MGLLHVVKAFAQKLSLCLSVERHRSMCGRKAAPGDWQEELCWSFCITVFKRREAIRFAESQSAIREN